MAAGKQAGWVMDSRYLLDRPIAFHRIFVALTGSITAALMLSQGVYWSLRTNDEEGWFWKTQEEWIEETGLTRKEQENARKKLRDLKFWQEELRGVPAKLHYRIDSDLLNIALQSAPNKLAQQRESAVEKAKRAAQKREERKQVRTKETNQFARKVQTGTHETGEHSLYTESTTQTTTERETHARTHEIFISESSVSEPKPKAKTVRAVRQGEETITFSTPIPLEQEPSPQIAPSPLPPAFDPVAPITLDTFTAGAQPEQSEAQKVFGEYFPGKALSKRQWQLIAEQVTDIPKWIRVCQRWSEVYTDWRNFGLLDWYRDGIPGVDNDRPTSGNFKGARKSEGESVSRPVAEFNYWEWQEDIKNGKYANEPY